MILVIDNYDSFTYNIVQQLGEFGADIEVYRNDQITLDQIRTMRPDQILISPGPGTPDDGGVSLDVIRELGADDAGDGRVPGASVHRAGLWRDRHAGRALDARQDQHDLSRGRPAV